MEMYILQMTMYANTNHFSLFQMESRQAFRRSKVFDGDDKFNKHGSTIAIQQ